MRQFPLKFNADCVHYIKQQQMLSHTHTEQYYGFIFRHLLQIIQRKVKLIILSECIHNMSPLITDKNLMKWTFFSTAWSDVGRSSKRCRCVRFQHAFSEQDFWSRILFCFLSFFIVHHKKMSFLRFQIKFIRFDFHLNISTS